MNGTTTTSSIGNMTGTGGMNNAPGMVDMNKCMTPSMLSSMNLGRDKVFCPDIWNAIDQAVHQECCRVRIGRKFLPIHGPISPEKTTVLSEKIIFEDGKLRIEEEKMLPLIELVAEFKLTLQQYNSESEIITAIQLARRAANHLAHAEDVVIFQGQDAIKGPKQHFLFKTKKVVCKSGTADVGLLRAAVQVIPVYPLQTETNANVEELRRYGENTYAAVALAYNRLQNGSDPLEQAHYGPYALVLHNEPFADTHAPLEKTLILTADRVKPLVEYGFHGTGTLLTEGKNPTQKMTTGVLVSVGGNTMDLVVGVDPITSFLQVDCDGNYCFRVFQRFALRVKDPTSIVRLEFMPTKDPNSYVKPQTK